MKAKYKITGPFGDRPEGAVITTHVLNIDEDSGIALCYHPPSGKYECGSFEFCKKNKKGQYVAIDSSIYSNIGELDKKFKRLLGKL